MSNTKESILLCALHLFARDGYEAVSVSDIAGAVGIGKSALYKHYVSKRDIFDSIVARMETLDTEWATEYELPQGTLRDMEHAYKSASVRQVIEFARSQFHRWTEDDFCSSFRKMLTLEQYRSEEMAALYQQHLVSGPLGYVTDLFCALGMEDAEEKAVELYAPMFLFYSMADGEKEAVGGKKTAASMLDEHMDRLCREWCADECCARPVNQ